jgi:hypothetical protein
MFKIPLKLTLHTIIMIYKFNKWISDDISPVWSGLFFRKKGPDRFFSTEKDRTDNKFKNKRPDQKTD